MSAAASLSVPVLAGIGEWFESVEREIIHWVACGLYAPWLDPFWLAIQEKTVALPLIGLGLLLYALWSPRRALRAALSGAVGFGVAMLVASLLWIAIERERPPHDYEEWLQTPAELASCERRPEALPLRKYASHSPSFPSKHGMTVGVFAAVLWLAWRPLGWGAIVLGAFIASGRVYAGKHWPSDVVVGVLLGAAIGWLVWRYLPAVLDRFRLGGLLREPAAAAPETGPTPE